MLIKNIELVEQLYITSVLVNKEGNKRIFNKLGLTVNLYAILAHVKNNINTNTEIQKTVEGSPASITQKLQKLESMDLIKRTLDKEDKRKWKFEATPKAEKIIKKIKPVYKFSLMGLFFNFKKEEKETLLRLLKKLETRVKTCI